MERLWRLFLLGLLPVLVGLFLVDGEGRSDILGRLGLGGMFVDFLCRLVRTGADVELFAISGR